MLLPKGTTLEGLPGRVFRQASYVQTTARRSHRCLWIEHADSISCLAVAATVHNAALLYSGYWDRTLKVWRIADLKCLEYIRAHDDTVNAVAAGAGVIYSGSADGASRRGRRARRRISSRASSSPAMACPVRYDAIENQLTADISHLMKILRRRYYLVEKAKDANIIGILVGTLGVGMHIVNLNIKSSYANVEGLLDCDLNYEKHLNFVMRCIALLDDAAGYLHIIEQMKELIKTAGKKSYTLVMGRPNSAKLANFPERNKKLRAQQKKHIFLLSKGVYVEDNCPQENEEQSEMSLALAEVTVKALSIQNQHNNDAVLYQGRAMSSIDYLKARSYRGLAGEYEGPVPNSILVGRTGRQLVTVMRKPRTHNECSIVPVNPLLQAPLFWR
ncbi:unnamed protein product [Miscanthus lutarioriparius]|uniref:Uncharacterized protein n=1 Tax=Miscanthus lutarioriparius TaxID=422564 RepID=A0A811MYH0_9POAL|nr:unnamed protein product [Miscanthus lutarioriparius]